MKKIVGAVLISLLMTNSSFATVKKNLLEKKSAPTIAWEIEAQNNVINLENTGHGGRDILVVVDAYLHNITPATKSDNITLMCGKKSYTVHAGSSLICELDYQENMRLSVNNKQFKHGASGTYILLAR